MFLLGWQTAVVRGFFCKTRRASGQRRCNNWDFLTREHFTIETLTKCRNRPVGEKPRWFLHLFFLLTSLHCGSGCGDLGFKTLKPNLWVGFKYMTLKWSGNLISAIFDLSWSLLWLFKTLWWETLSHQSSSSYHSLPKWQKPWIYFSVSQWQQSNWQLHHIHSTLKIASSPVKR